mgnify:FL=1
MRWQAGPLRQLDVQFVSLVTDATNWQDTVSTGGDTGGSGVAGDWRFPRTLGQIDLGPGNSGTDLDAKSKYIYMTAEASDIKKPDFFIIDAN